MTQFRKALAVVVLGAAGALSWFGVSSLVQNVQFARASEQIEATRKQLETIEGLSNVYRSVAKVVEPSVVEIKVAKTIRASRTNSPDGMLRRFFGDGDQQEVPEDEYLAVGEGSGVIMETDGNTAYILTNNHVAGGASELRVTLSDGREIDNATLVGADPKSDLAVVKISAPNLQTAHWGNSDTLEKGDLILAFGSPFGYVGSMTHGIVSALNRQARIIEGPFQYENFIQVDAPINPGNSGGPLVNLKGEVVGINTAIASRSGSFAGLGFAIPSNMAKPVYEQLKEKGKVVRGWLGVTIGNAGDPKLREALTDSGYSGNTGVFVSAVLNDTPASGKLHPGDVITAIDGKQVDNVTQLRDRIATTPPGTEVKVSYVRSGKSQDATMKVEEQPKDLLARTSPRAENQGRRETEDATPSADALGVRFVTPNEAQLDRFSLEAGAKGALVTGVQQASVGASAGIRPGDLITRIGDQPIKTAADASAALAKQDLTKGIRFTITSKDGDRFVFVKGK